MRPVHLCKHALFAAAMALLASPAFSDSFDPKHVPADAKWVVHVDMDATRKGKLWEILNGRLAQDPIAQAKIDAISSILGIRFPDDIRGVTVFGTGAEGQGSAILLNANLDPDKITTLLKANEAYKKTTYGTHDILSWHDKETNKTMFGLFVSPTLAILADTSEEVQATVDVLDGKAKSLDAENPLTQGKGSTILFYIAGNGLSDLPPKQNPESPILSQLNSAWLTLSEEESKIVIRAALKAKSSDTAEQIKSMAEGCRAGIILSAGSAKADPKAKIAAAVLQSMVLKQEGPSISVEWPVPMENVAAMLDGMGHPPVNKLPQKPDAH